MPDLSLLLAACHHAIPQNQQTLLVLNKISGFNLKELSDVFVLSRDKISNDMLEAETRLEKYQTEEELEEGALLGRRLLQVMKVLLSIFNEGMYGQSDHSDLKRHLSMEAIRLGDFLLTTPARDLGQLQALLGMMYFQAARFDARVNGNGQLITLDKQDRKLWNRQYIENGRMHLDKASQSDYRGSYLLQAHIESLHCSAGSYKETDWHQILGLYDLLMKCYPSHIFSIRRLIAFSMVYSPGEALEQMAKLEVNDTVRQLKVYDAVKAYLLEQLNEKEASALYYALASEKSYNPVEQAFFTGKVTESRKV